MHYPLISKLRPSGRARLMIAAIHSVAAIAFLGSSIEPPFIVAALLALGFSCWRALHAELQKARLTLILEESGLLRLIGPGSDRTGYVHPASADFGWAVWLGWRDRELGPARRRAPAALMLLPDNIEDECWRPLRIWIRHKADTGTSRADVSGPTA